MADSGARGSFYAILDAVANTTAVEFGGIVSSLPVTSVDIAHIIEDVVCEMITRKCRMLKEKVQWLFTHYDVTSRDAAKNVSLACVEGNELQLLQWIDERIPTTIVPMLYYTVLPGTGNVDVAKYLHSKHGLFGPDMMVQQKVSCVESALRCRRFSFVEWMEDTCCDFSDDAFAGSLMENICNFDENSATEARKLMEWVHSKFQNSSPDTTSLIRQAMLSIMVQQPEVALLDWALQMFDIPHKLFQSKLSELLRKACMAGSKGIAEKLMEHQMAFNGEYGVDFKFAINKIMSTGDIDTLNWLHHHPFLSTKVFSWSTFFTRVRDNEVRVCEWMQENRKDESRQFILQTLNACCANEDVDAVQDFVKHFSITSAEIKESGTVMISPSNASVARFFIEYFGLNGSEIAEKVPLYNIVDQGDTMILQDYSLVSGQEELMPNLLQRAMINKDVQMVQYLLHCSTTSVVHVQSRTLVEQAKKLMKGRYILSEIEQILAAALHSA